MTAPAQSDPDAAFRAWCAGEGYHASDGYPRPVPLLWHTDGRGPEREADVRARYARQLALPLVAT